MSLANVPGFMPRRDFLKQSVFTAGAIGVASGLPSAQVGAASPLGLAAAGAQAALPAAAAEDGPRRYDGVYAGSRNSRVAFPMGGIGAGMICLEGTGALSHVSLRQQPEVYNEPCVFAAVSVPGRPELARVLEGPVPTWKLFGPPDTGNGATGKNYGLPRFARAVFRTRFPFGIVAIEDAALPIKAEITGWSPFVPGDADASSLPVAALEYRLVNASDRPLSAVFSFNTRNFMQRGKGRHGVRPIAGGFVLFQEGTEEAPQDAGAFCARVTDPAVKVNHAWFRGGWFDSLTMAWKDVHEAACYDRPPITEGDPAPGASLFVPLELPPGGEKTVVLQLCWHAGRTTLRHGNDPEGVAADPGTHVPWYAARFADIDAVAETWSREYDSLRRRSTAFADCFYDTNLPPEVIEAVAANLTILKSPTVLRQADGRIWAWEGCCDNRGCCAGSCTHVWNYAQAMPHLFPALERTLRETEFEVSQDDRGHQAFRSALPIRPLKHDFHAAADGQLGGIMKVHREWRISGDTQWLRRLWPKVKASLSYCIETWDPGHKGVLEEPHHNTYDIEFWGPDGMCTSFYLGALAAAVNMGKALGDEVPLFAELLEKGLKYAHEKLFDGEYFIQEIRWEGLRASSPTELHGFGGGYSPEAVELLRKEGPKYQYGKGCLADGVLGSWMALVCGVGQVLDPDKVVSHLRAVHRYNLRRDLSTHANPQRPSFACGAEGGLLLCTWPKGEALSLPFVYSNEVWTGIEYQVASHLMMMGCVEEGLEIVRVCRDRYDGRIRNPFNEYECGHWYARAMSSYGLLQGLSGARYDAVEKVLYLRPRVKGDFRAFIATAGGYGTVGVKDGKPFLEVRAGAIDVQRIDYVPCA